MIKRNSKIKYLAALPAVIIMLLIFIFSSREAEESSVQSLKVSYCIAGMEGFFMGLKLSAEQILAVALAIEWMVRKAAHITEYAILTAAVWFALYFWTKSKRVLYFSTVVFCIFYAATDEVHQLFVKGRSGKPEDVLIDAVGILAAAGVIYFIEVCCLKRSEESLVEFNEGVIEHI